MKKEKKLVNKLFLLPIILAISIFSIFLVSGATVTLTVPATRQNYTTLTWSCATSINASANNYNVTIFYNATGGGVRTKLESKSNTSASQSSFSNSVDIESLADKLTYNFTCYADNGTTQQYSPQVLNVGIDNTPPVVSISTDQSSAYQTKNIGLNWSCTDATSGVQTNSVSTSVNGDAGCVVSGTTSWTTATGSQTLTTTQTQCAGLYTNSLSCTDTASNSNTASSTFNIYYPEGGSGVIPIKQKTIIPTKTSTQSNKTLFVIIAMGVIIFIAIISFLVISISKKRR
jgi:hypothetical protein